MEDRKLRDKEEIAEQRRQASIWQPNEATFNSVVGLLANSVSPDPQVQAKIYNDLQIAQ
jgi:hypothetical protein